MGPEHQHYHSLQRASK